MKKIILIIALLCILSFSACCRKEEVLGLSEIESVLAGEGNPDRENVPAEEPPVWNDEHISLNNRFSKAVLKNGIIYGYFTGETGITVISQDAQEGTVLRETEIQDATEAYSIAVDGLQNIYLLGNANGNDMLWKIDNGGQVSIVADFVLEDMENAVRFSPNAFFADDNGYFYLWYKLDIPLKEFYEDAEDDVYTEADRIYVKDSQMDTLFYEQVPYSNDCRLLDFSLGERGVPAILAKDTEGVYLQELDTGRKEASAKKRISGMPATDAYGTICVTEDGFLFCRDSMLYEYFIGEQEVREILSLPTYGIFTSDILYLGMAGERIEVIMNPGESGGTECAFLREGQSDKVQISLGVMQSFQELETAVTRFNRSHDDVRIGIVTYYDEKNGFEAGLEKLNLDIVRGKAPDLLETSMIDYEILSQKEVFADLYPYMDTDFNREHMLEEIVRIYELNGHLYTIAPYFQLHSMWGNFSGTEGRYGVTFEEMMGLLGNLGRDINAIYGFSADEPVLTTLCTMGMDEFVDWENGTCDFEGESFAAVLKFVKAYNGGYSGESLSAGIQSGDVLLSAGIISSVADYQIQSELYGGNLDFIGYPVAHGTGTSASLTGAQLAINAKSQNPDLAWEFIRYYLTEDDSGQGFPIVKDRFETAMEQAKEAVYSLSVEGEVKLPQMTYMDADTHIEVYEAAQEEIDAVKSLVGRADSKFKYHTKIQKIIDEETAYFFNGQKELEEVTGLIQNRVELLLSTNDLSK